MSAPRTSLTDRRVVAVSGNPRPGSRTTRVANTVTRVVAERLGFPEPEPAIELAQVADQIFAAEAPELDRYRAELAGAAVIVVATPVYKASYTGLLKGFVDRFPGGGLAGVVAVPVVVSASPAHSFVAEHLLAPLLVELGAVVPVRGLAVIEGQLDDIEATVRTWIDHAGPVLQTVAADRHPEPVR